MAVEYDALKRLARLFAPYADLYAVGGFVRDGLLGISSYDLDICSKLDVKTVKNILLNSDFAVCDRNLRMGTVIITGEGFKAEYTTFRTDSYDRKSGRHTPLDVVFTDNVALDARRRDFCCNAVYFNPLTGAYTDPTGGIEDIRKKVIRTADVPKNVFEADGLRILRMVRFAAELGFSIDDDTMRAAKANAWRVKDIAAERVRDELDKIFVADTKHKELCLRDAHLRGVELLDELGLIDMLLPPLSALKGLEQPKKYHIYDAYRHSLKAFEVSPPGIRWAALLHDVGKAEAVAKQGNMHTHELYGEKTVSAIADSLRFSKERKRRLESLVRWHMTDVNGNMSDAKLRRFAVEHIDVMDDLCALKRADAIASCGQYTNTRLADAYAALKADGTPLNIAQLKVDGRDLIGLGVPESDRGKLLDDLLYDTVLNPALNDRDRALQYISRKINARNNK